MMIKIATDDATGPANSPNADELLTEAQTASLLNVEPRTVRLWRLTRGLPFLRVTSKVIRLRRRDLNEWLNEGRTVISQ